MKLRLTRLGFGSDSTLGDLEVVRDVEEGNEFLCHTLEDELRDVKVPGDTCIPAATYEVLPRDAGGMTAKYRARFLDMHIGMAWLQDVPGFSYVYIHIGNDDDDTEGCILVGMTYQENSDGNFTIGQSAVAYEKVYELIAAAWARGEKVFIEVVG